MKVPLYFEGIPGGDNCTDDILARGAYIIEGISGGDNFSDGNEEWKKKMLLHWQGPGPSAHSNPQRSIKNIPKRVWKQIKKDTLQV